MEESVKKALVVLILLFVVVFSWFAYLSDDAVERGDVLAHAPVITVMEILHARDLQAGIKTAVADNNDEAITSWMQEALKVGEAAGLSKDDINYLTSSQAQNYVVFNAKRQLFNDAFEKRYFALKGMGNLKSEYPEAQDLFERTEQLLLKRDAIIEQMAVALSGSETPSPEAIAQAKQQWLQQAQKNAD